MDETTRLFPWAVLALTLMSAPVFSKTIDLGHGFRDHGVATPVSNHRGIVATADGQGRDVLLIWLFDHRGGYALLMVDADTGKSEEFPMPFPPGGDCPYASVLSSGNRYYTHFNSHFCEFDPTQRKFTFEHQTAPQMAMSMTEDDEGVIWSATYPQSGLVSYDPQSGEFHDYGHLYRQNWRQYPRSIAADDAGWIYIGIGSAAAQILVFDPRSGTTKPLLPDGERPKGYGQVTRDIKGKVYGKVGDRWWELYRGQARPTETPDLHPKPIIAGSQGLFHQRFPSGRVARRCDTVERELVIQDPQTGKTKTLHFDYDSEGAHLMGVCTAPDDTICGGTAFPMRFFSYNPRKDEWTNRAAYGQWNTVARQGDRFFVGGYTHGFLLEWDPARPWVPTVPAQHNPATLGWGFSGADHYHFRGLIDEVRIYDRALSAAELAAGDTDGSVAAWLLNEGEGEVAHDASGHDIHGRLHGARWAQGRSGTAVAFDGRDDYIEIPDAPGLHVGDQLTIEAWVFPTPPHQKGYGGLINNIAGTANSRLLILNDGRTLAQVVIGGGKEDVWGPSVRNNEWNHVAYIYDGRHEWWAVNGVAGDKHPRKGSLTVESNPRFLTSCHPDINRPHDLLAHPDGHTLVLAGTPGYGYTGGGLLFWDRTAQQRVLLKHTDLLPEHSTMSLAPLPGGKLLGGSTTAAGTGGEKKAEQAELYILDMATKKLEWHAPLLPGVQSYHDMVALPDGRILGVADRHLLFLFDANKRAIVRQRELGDQLGSTNSQQGPRVFVTAPDGTVYLLLVKGIARVDGATLDAVMVAPSPVPIGPGGDYLDGRIYFGSGSHLYSYQLPE